VVDVAGPAARQTQVMGQSLMRAGSAMADLAQQALQEANQLRVDDAIVQLAKVRTDLQVEALQVQGRNALERESGKPLPVEYTDRFDEAVQSISRGLGNDAQRRAFGSGALRMGAQMYGDLRMHEAREYIAWQADSAKAKLEVAIDQLAQLPANEALFSQSLGAIRESFAAQVKQQGGDEAMFRAGYRKLADQAYYTRYKAWQVQDPVGALASFQAHQGEIGPVMRSQISAELFAHAAPQLAEMAVPWMRTVGSAPADRPDLATEPRGVRNANPGNLVKTATAWQGEIPGDDPRFATFATHEAGIRAMGKTLLTYQDGYGLGTVEEIISRWAPASDKNDVPAYVATVAEALGVEPGAPIDLHNPQIMSKMVRAMIQVENGKQPYTDAQINTGIGAALGTASLPAQPAVSAPAQPTWRTAGVQTGNAVIDNLPPNQRIRVFELARSKDREHMTQSRAEVQSRAADAEAEYLTLGAASNPPGADDFVAAYGQDEGMRRYQQLQDTASLGQTLQQVKTTSDADLAQQLADAKPEPGDGFAARWKNYEALQKAVQTTVESRRKDPVAFALANPAYGIAPLAFGAPGSNLDADLREMAHRASAMDQIANDYGSAPAVLSNQEAAAFGKFIEPMQAQDKARVLGRFAEAAGPAAMQSISAQLKDKDNSLAIAAMLSGHREVQTHLFGDDTEGADAALLYLQGREAIEEKRAFIDAAAETGIKAQIFEAIHDVYLTPQGRTVAAEAAYGIYAGLKAQGNDDVERAVTIATGGIMNYNGGRIAKPYGWSDGRFRDALAETVPERIAAAGGEYLVSGQPISAAELAERLPAARLQTFGQGSYLVMAGGDVVRTPDGAPFLLGVE